MKLTTKKKAIRGFISLGMALLVVGFAAGCSKKLMPPEIEASSGSGSSGGMMGSSLSSGGGISEGSVGDPGSTGGGTGGAGGGAGTGFNITEQSEGGMAGSGSTGTSGGSAGGSPFVEETFGESGGGMGHAGEGPGFFTSEDQNFGSGSGPLPGNGSDGFAPQDGMASSSGGSTGGSHGSSGHGSSGGSFETFGSGNRSGGAGSLGEGGSTLDHPAETHHPFHGELGGMASSGGSTGGSTGGGTTMGGMTQQEARLADFTESSDLNDIHFAYDKYDLTEESKQVLRTNADWLKSNPAARIEIQGHCDERGTNNYNLGLGERRALSTKKFLTALGVDANRIFTISYGEEKPFCFDSNDACWTQNRRAHFMVAR